LRQVGRLCAQLAEYLGLALTGAGLQLVGGSPRSRTVPLGSLASGLQRLVDRVGVAELGRRHGLTSQRQPRDRAECQRRPGPRFQACGSPPTRAASWSRSKLSFLILRSKSRRTTHRYRIGVTRAVPRVLTGTATAPR